MYSFQQHKFNILFILSLAFNSSFIAIAATDSQTQQNAPEGAGDVVPPNELGGMPYIINTRRNLATGEAPETYTVEEGDTLFDICDQLIDEPDYWPKLWALNPGIQNPHFIFPGMKLKFYPGDLTLPPFLQVVTEQDLVPIEGDIEQSSDIVEVILGKVKVEDENDLNFPILNIKDQKFDPEIEKNIFSYGEIYQPQFGEVDIPAFVFESRPETLGEIIGGPGGEILIKEKELVVVEQDAPLAPGSLYTVVRYTKDLSSEEVGYIGERYDFVAQIKIIRPISHDDDYVLARVIKSHLGIQPHDQIIPYRSTRRQYRLDYANNPASKTAKYGEIIAFNAPDQTIGGQGHLVYIDRPLEKGATYQIFQTISKRLPDKSEFRLPEIQSQIGQLQIMDHIGPTALGIITYSIYDIHLGDKLRLQ